MGNQNGSGQAGIYVRTDKPFYFAGETVTGNMFLNVIEGIQGGELNLKIKGYENCHWEETRTVWETKNGQQVSKQVVDKYDNDNTFFRHKFCLYRLQNGHLQPGQYTFPFQFILRTDLPGSFNFKQFSTFAEIKYKIKADVDITNGSKNEIKHSQELIVREPIKSEFKTQYGEMTLNASTCCCISKGVSQIKCLVDKNIYLPGEDAQLLVQVDNTKCQLDVSEIRATFTQQILLKSKQGHQKSLSYVLSGSSLPGIGAGQSAMNENRQHMKLPLVNNQNQGESNLEVLQPSTSGTIVKNNYTVTGQASLDGTCMCCSGSPYVTVPVNIVAAVPSSYEQVPQIQNWNPQMMPTQTFQFSDGQVYNSNKGYGNPTSYNYNQNLNNMNNQSQIYHQVQQ